MYRSLTQKVESLRKGDIVHDLIAELNFLKKIQSPPHQGQIETLKTIITSKIKEIQLTALKDIELDATDFEGIFDDVSRLGIGESANLSGKIKEKIKDQLEYMDLTDIQDDIAKKAIELGAKFFDWLNKKS